MLDLKAKLAAAGLVSAADVAAAERKGTGPKGQDRKTSQSGPGNRDNRPNQPNHGNQPNPARDAAPRSNSGMRSADPRGRGPRNDGPRNDAPRNNPRHDAGPRAAKPAGKPGLDVVALKRGGKGEAYDAIRRAVERNRLDPPHGIPGEQAEAFHFMTATGQLSRLMLEPEARTLVTDGGAGIIAFMSHHGLAHCVVPRPVAEAVAEVFPLWLRVLKDHPGAGQQEAPRPPPEPAAAASAASAEPPAASAEPPAASAESAAEPSAEPAEPADAGSPAEPALE